MTAVVLQLAVVLVVILAGLFSCSSTVRFARGMTALDRGPAARLHPGGPWSRRRIGRLRPARCSWGPQPPHTAAADVARLAGPAGAALPSGAVVGPGPGTGALLPLVLVSVESPAGGCPNLDDRGADDRVANGATA